MRSSAKATCFLPRVTRAQYAARGERLVESFAKDRIYRFLVPCSAPGMYRFDRLVSGFRRNLGNTLYLSSRNEIGLSDTAMAEKHLDQALALRKACAIAEPVLPGGATLPQ